MLSGANPFDGGSQAEALARILEREPAPLSQQVPGTPPELEQAVTKALSKNREGRYRTTADLLTDLRAIKNRLQAGNISPAKPGPSRNRRLIIGAVGLLALIVSSATAIISHRRKPPNTDRDTIFLADFANTTGDLVFDGALKQGLAIQLEQSPFLDLFPEARTRQALRLMQRSPEERITKEVARELCQRQGLKAFVAGSIAPIGTHYAIGLECVNAESGDVIAQTQAEAASKEQVLTAVTHATKDLRRRLGESLASIQKFDTPLDLTTSSLEALKAFSSGYQENIRGRFLDAIPFEKRAVELDPNFAYAYSGLATAYNNTGQRALAAEYAQKAHALRDRVTELEKLRLSEYYFAFVTDEKEKQIEVLKLRQRLYPRDYRAPGNLASAYNTLGRYEKAEDAARESLRRNSPSAVTRINLSIALIALGRAGEAKAVLDGALGQKIDGSSIHRFLFQIAFLNRDEAAMRQQLESAHGKAEEYESIGIWQAQSASFEGGYSESTSNFQKGMEMASRAGLTEIAAGYGAEKALRAAAVGDCAPTIATVAQALSFSHGRDVLERGALALALCGRGARAAAVPGII